MKKMNFKKSVKRHFSDGIIITSPKSVTILMSQKLSKNFHVENIFVANVLALVLLLKLSNENQIFIILG